MVSGGISARLIRAVESKPQFNGFDINTPFAKRQPPERLSFILSRTEPAASPLCLDDCLIARPEKVFLADMFHQSAA
jgi:hypothetical protein